MELWQNFYFLCGSSAAGLTGLMFIAVTFGSKLVTEKNMDQVNIFLSAICFHFIQTFFLCCVASVPYENRKIVAAAAALTGLWRLSHFPKIFRIVKQSSKGDDDIEASDWLISLLFPTLVYIGLIVTGYLFYIGAPMAPYMLAFCLISLLMIATRGAWDMLIWIATKVE